MIIFSVDYALEPENVSWVYETSRGLGFVPFVGNRALDRYVEEDRPDDGGGYALRAEAQLGLGPQHREEAIKDLEEARLLAPWRRDVRNELERLRDETGPPPPEGRGYSAP